MTDLAELHARILSAYQAETLRAYRYARERAAIARRIRESREGGDPLWLADARETEAFAGRALVHAERAVNDAARLIAQFPGQF